MSVLPIALLSVSHFYDDGDTAKERRRFPLDFLLGSVRGKCISKRKQQNFYIKTWMSFYECAKASCETFDARENARQGFALRWQTDKASHTLLENIMKTSKSLLCYYTLR